MTAVKVEVEAVGEQVEEVILAPRPRPRRPSAKLDDAGRRALLEKHAGLAQTWAAGHKREARKCGIEVEELAQAAYLGLDDASRHYNPAKGPFERYAWGYAKRQIIERLEEERRVYFGVHHWAMEPDDPDDLGHGGGQDELPSNAREISDLLARIGESHAATGAFRAASDGGRFDERDRRILDAVRRGRKQAEIAIELGCGLSTVQRRQRSLIEKLREIVGK